MISICMAYYNRKDQLYKTIESIKSSNEEYEIILVDDGSDSDQALIDIESPGYRSISSPKEKTWVNPCIAYNKAIALAKGDIVIIQNPECMHIGNVLKYTKDNLKKYQYMAFSCLSWDQSELNIDEAKSLNYAAAGQCSKGWYHHPVYNNRPFHFCVAIHKDNLDKLNGFDERFKDGPCYDDSDLVRRAQKLGLQIVSPTDPFVIHQWHDSSHIYKEDSHQRFLNNQKLFNDIITGKLESWS